MEGWSHGARARDVTADTKMPVCEPPRCASFLCRSLVQVRMASKKPPQHPGAVLRGCGVPCDRLAWWCGIPRSRMRRLWNETQGMTPDTALRLAKALPGMGTAGYWMN